MYLRPMTIRMSGSAIAPAAAMSFQMIGLDLGSGRMLGDRRIEAERELGSTLTRSRR
jgi:hypothetical protein